jgi:hypothetical protein
VNNVREDRGDLADAGLEKRWSANTSTRTSGLLT